MRIHPVAGRGRLAAARIACVPVIVFGGQLIAGEAQLRGVDDDHEFAGVEVRRVLGAVFAAQDVGDLHRQPADHLIGRIDDEPALRHLVRLRHKRGHDDFVSLGPTDRKNHHKAMGRSRQERGAACIPSRRSAQWQSDPNFHPSGDAADVQCSAARAGLSRPPPRRHAFGLPAGSVRALLALAVLGLLWTVALTHPHGETVSEADKHLPTILIGLQILMVLILVHFFTAHGNTIGRHISGASPLGLPGGSIRFRSGELATSV